MGDLVAENQLEGSPQWRKGLRRATDPQLTGVYADRSSVFAGEGVTLFVSTQAKTWTAQAYRMGSYGDTQARLVASSEPQKGKFQEDAGYRRETQTHFAKWQASLSLDTADWQPGMYLIRIRASDRNDWFVPLVVRSASVSGRLVFVMSDLTWQAYNNWGGRSAYEGPGGRPDRSRAVSFSRPYANGSGSGKYLAHEHPAVVLAEAAGYPVSYVAASDLARGDGVLAGAAGVVFLGHDEYWTQEERARVTQARDAGVDLAFLGANTMYWRVRMDWNGPQNLPLEIIYKSAEEDPVGGATATARFRDRPSALAERELIGQQYECFPATGKFTIATPQFFGFAGTGVKRGDTIPAILDIEVDRAYLGAFTPTNLQVVAASPTECEGAATTSTATYYTHRSGAGVFSTGTMGWVLQGLRESAPTRAFAFTTRVTQNILDAMVAGQMGAQFPASPNLERFDLPKVNTTGKA